MYLVLPLFGWVIKGPFMYLLSTFPPTYLCNLCGPHFMVWTFGVEKVTCGQPPGHPVPPWPNIMPKIALHQVFQPHSFAKDTSSCNLHVPLYLPKDEYTMYIHMHIKKCIYIYIMIGLYPTQFPWVATPFQKLVANKAFHWLVVSTHLNNRESSPNRGEIQKTCLSCHRLVLNHQVTMTTIQKKNNQNNLNQIGPYIRVSLTTRSPSSNWIFVAPETWIPISWNRRLMQCAAARSPSSLPRAPCRPLMTIFFGARWGWLPGGSSQWLKWFITMGSN